ncbi:MAG: glycosyltransferase [Puniceicoccales bacterium]|nr:glycosyltransferase [Puniceicoccales bacterium]
MAILKKILRLKVLVASLFVFGQTTGYCESSPPPKVSICIAVYNGEPYVGGAIDSALAQTCGDIEIVCLDDGSTDGTAAILSAYAAKDPRVRIFSNGSNRGLLHSLLRCIELSSGDYIMWLDADDELYPDIVERSYGKAVDTKADLVLFASDWIANDGTKVGVPQWAKLRGTETATALDGGIKLLELYAEDKVTVFVWGKLWSRERLRNILPALVPFGEVNNVSRSSDVAFNCYALWEMRNYVVIGDAGHRYYAKRGVDATCGTKNFAYNRKCVSDAIAAQNLSYAFGDATGQMKLAQKIANKMNWDMFCKIDNMSRSEGFAAFDEVLQSTPAQHRKEILNDMKKIRRHFYSAYEKNKSAQQRKNLKA